MFKRAAVLIVALSWHAGVAFADQPKTTAPPVPTGDPRIQRYLYSENTVYKLDLYLKSVTALQFSDSEEVESILIGDSASWEVVKLKVGNVVSVKPIIASAATNMTIYTDKRVYAFEMRSLGEFVDGTRVTPPPFRHIFTYPVIRKPRPVRGALAERIDSNYLVSGHAAFRPIWVQDNGRQTSFFLPINSPRPAIFKVGSDKSEQLINSRTQADRIVVDGTSDNWVLRIGNEAICVGRAAAVKMKAGLSIFPKRGGHADAS